MTKQLAAAWLLLLAASNGIHRMPSAVAAGEIIPLPQEVELTNSHFTWRNNFVVSCDKPTEQAAQFLTARIRQGLGISSTVVLDPPPTDRPGEIVFQTVAADEQLGSEGYALDISETQITVQAAAPAGAFYAAISLCELLPPEVFAASSKGLAAPIQIPTQRVRDWPRFSWRGAMLDCSRHFFSVPEIKLFLDSMALHKLNRFHWHLTDDQGWRIAIRAYPMLTEKGAWRDGIGFELNPKDSDKYDAQGRYGGYYSQDDIREIVQYAAQRQIMVIPEIEMPGHSLAALSVYPNLSCTGGPVQISERAGVAHNVFCAGNDATFEFLEGVLDEVVQLFPARYVHIGGDECPKDNWHRCEKCQERIRAENLHDEHELQSYFIKRIEKHLRLRGRQLIGWDEIIEGGLAPSATVMSWRGMEHGVTAAKMGHDAIMSPTSHCYLDYYQAKQNEPRAIGGFLPLEKVYQFQPVPPQLSPEQAGHILGLQGNLWTEYVPNARRAEYMAYPRLSALAEIGWSADVPRDLPNFLARVKQNEARLQQLGVSFRPLEKDTQSEDP